MNWSEWLPPLAVGVMFTSIAMLKFYALARGIEGGPGKTWWQRMRGTCPKDNCIVPGLNWWGPTLFLCIGMINLVDFITTLINH